MRQVQSPLRAAITLRRLAPGLIAIDGTTGVGKSTLGRALAKRLSRPLVHLDHFVRRRRGAYVKSLLRAKLTQRIRRNDDAIVEGVCVLQVLQVVSLPASTLVYVKRMRGGRWLDEDELVPQVGLEEHLASLRADIALIAGKAQTSSSLGIIEEVIRYHVRYRPQDGASIEYLRTDA